ncbi:MAG: hypothetical protein ACPHQP_00455 [Longimicrobiales bacterium]
MRRPGRTVRTAPLTSLLTTVLLLTAAPALAQETGATVSVSAITLSHDTVGIGDLVDLSFVIDMAPGTIVFVPDSLDSSDFESFESVRWTSQNGVDGGVRLTVTYPLMAFQVGGIAVPEFPIFAARGSEARSAGFASDGDLVGRWSAFRAEPGETPSARMLMIPPQPLWVASVLEIEDASNGVQPRPVADVVGGERHWPATILAILFGIVFIGILSTSAHAVWVAIRDRPVAAPDPRLATLAALDALLEEGPHRGGDVRAFYTRASDITRRFVEVFDQRWGPARTSTELMGDLETAVRRPDFVPIPEVEPLTGVMEHAEEVKFGGDRPDAEEAERELSAVRRWVEGAEAP